MRRATRDQSPYAEAVKFREQIQTSGGLVSVFDLPLACCAVESSLAWADPNPTVANTEPVAAVLCVSGTVSRKSAPLLSEAWSSLKAEFQAVKVIAVGACASSGGPYWDSPAVVPAETLVPVDLMVPGCPPRPSEIRAAVDQVMAG